MKHALTLKVTREPAADAERLLKEALELLAASYVDQLWEEARAELQQGHSSARILRADRSDDYPNMEEIPT